MSKVKMKKHTSDIYTSNNGHTLCREFGKAPNGNLINGRWVLRDGNGNWVDMDKYRNDLTERNNLQLR